MALPELLYSKWDSVDQNFIIVWVIGLGEGKLSWSSPLGDGSTRSHPLTQAQVVLHNFNNVNAKSDGHVISDSHVRSDDPDGPSNR